MKNKEFLTDQKEEEIITPDGDREETNKQDDINRGRGESED
jgi:hypothetical protein